MVVGTKRLLTQKIFCSISIDNFGSRVKTLTQELQILPCSTNNTRAQLLKIKAGFTFRFHMQ
jgi:hypothetical protein